MEINFMKWTLPLGLLISFHLIASVPKKANDDLARYRSEVVEMGARLSTLEKEIGSKNNLYLSSIEQIKQFEADVKIYRDQLHEIRIQVGNAQRENKRILTSYLTESENESTDSQFLFGSLSKI